ncbi:MAG: HD family phosphohydrolase [Pseudanabaenaceae cyanobacterium]
MGFAPESKADLNLSRLQCSPQLTPKLKHLLPRWLPHLIAGVTSVSLGATLSLRFVDEPQLVRGMLVYSDIRVPKTIEAVDIEATRQAQEKVKQQVIPVLRLSEEVNQSVRQHLESLLSFADNLRAKAGHAIYTNFLTEETQKFLRQRDGATWEQLQRRVNRLAIGETRGETRSNESETNAVNELLRLKVTLSTVEYQNLINQVTAAQQSYSEAMAMLNQGPAMFRESLLNLSDGEWTKLKQQIRTGLEDLLAGGMVGGLQPDMQSRRIDNLRSLPESPVQRRLAANVLATVIKPNLTIDYLATAQRATKAAEEMQSQKVVLRQGDVVVRAGEKISERQFAFLDALGLTQRRTNWWGILLAVTVATGGVVVFAYAQRRWSGWFHMKLHPKDWLVFSLVCTGGALGTVLMPYSILGFLPLASLGLVLGSFYGSRLATFATVLTCGLLTLGISFELLGMVPIFVGAITAALMTNRPLTRSHLAMTGILVALLQASVYVAMAMVAGTTPPILIMLIALQYAAGGLFSAIMALGAIPYLDHVSYVLTPFRLAELANLDRPLLRRLVAETPGTFQHTLFVANLAEAAARELGADTTLVRTGTLYHDVGKTLKPEYFIENQSGVSNPHDSLNDPWLSTQIIKEHVTGGIKLAQKYHLPPLLQAFIPEHQGTIVIAYFYHQAQKRYNGSEGVSEIDFRYEGPIPQSRETGVVMLADACEAGLRSLGPDTTLEEARTMIMKIFQSRWDDGQLVDSDLSWSDLEKIAPVFIKVWQDRNHGRIKYPALAKKLDPSGSALPDQNLDQTNLMLVPPCHGITLLKNVVRDL